jgi:sugar/nucleoside kinase (ribokinase family)
MARNAAQCRHERDTMETTMSIASDKDIDVLGFGIVVYDVFARPLDTVPDWGKLLTFDEISHNVGGCATNTTSDVVRLGASAMIGGCVGDDPTGEAVKAKLVDAGLNIDGLTVLEGQATSFTFIAIGSDGQRRFFHTVGANASISDTHCPDALLSRSKILHIGGTLLMPGFDGEPTAKLLKRAKDLGLTTSMDTAFNGGVDAPSLVSACFPYLDILIPSIEEAELIAGSTDPAVILDMLGDTGIPVVGIKLGPEGSVVRAEGETYWTPAYKVEAVDTTGAGDAFMAGFLYGTLHGWPVEKRARFATAVAAFCIQAVGCSTNIAPAEEVLDFMENAAASPLI